MRLYVELALPNVTTLPYYSTVYYTNDIDYTGAPVSFRENSGGGVTKTVPFKREGFQVESFSKNMGVSGYEPGGAVITFDDSMGNWRTAVNGANVRGCYVYIYRLELNGEIYTDNRLATLKIKNWHFPSPLKFQFELSDDSPDRVGNGMPIYTLDGEYQFPAMDTVCEGKFINIGFGSFSGVGALNYDHGGMAWGGKINEDWGGGNTCHFLCTFSPGVSSMTINRVWYGGAEQTTPGLWDTVNQTAYFTSGQEGRRCGVEWQAALPGVEITFEADYWSYCSTRMISILIGVMGGFEAMVYNSTKNAAFQAEMLRRGMDGSSSTSYLRAIFQEKKTPQDLLTEFCDSVGLARWRVNRLRQVELIALTPGNLTADYTLNSCDVLGMEINSNYDEIENQFNYEYCYIPYSGEAVLRNTFQGWNKKRSQALYGKIEPTDRKLLRWIYDISRAYRAAQFDAIDRCLPRIECRVILNEDTVTPLLLPGDVVKFKYPDDLGKGTADRWYWIERLSVDFIDGGIVADMLDITYYQSMEYTRKLSIQPQLSGQTFYDSSIACYTINPEITNKGTDKMVIAADAGALSGYSWRTNDAASSDAYLFWSTTGTNFGNILNFTNYCVSFRVKMTDLTTEQCFFCISRLSAQIDFWRIGFNPTNKTIFFGFTINNVSIFNFNTSTNSINDITTWHHVVLQKIGTAIQVYVDGVYEGGTTTAATNAQTGDVYVGIKYAAGSTYSLPFLGYMEELHVWHEANPWSANGSTCTAQTAPATWFGINNAWPFYGTPA